MASKKNPANQTFPNPLPGESYDDYVKRAYRPPASARPGETLGEFTNRKAAYNIDFNNKLADSFPGEHQAKISQNLAEQEAYAAGSQAGRAAAASTVPPVATAAPRTTTTTTAPRTSTTTPTSRATTTTAPTTMPPTTVASTGAESVIGSMPPASTGVTADEETVWPYAPPPRWGYVSGVPEVRRQGTADTMETAPKYGQYTGPGLVNSAGVVVKDQDGNIFYYDPSNDAGKIYAGMSATDRLATLNALYQKGFYSSGKVGEYNADTLAIARWLEASNNAGVTRDRFLREMGTLPNTQPSSGAGRRISLTNPDDLKAVAKKVSLDGLGRELNDEELTGFVNYFQNLERRYQTGASSTDAPSASVGAQNYLASTAGQEQDAYTYMNFVNKIFSSIGG